MTFEPVNSLTVPLQLVVMIAGVGTAVHSVERLRSLSVVSESGILSWAVLRQQDPTTRTDLLDRVCSARGLYYVHILHGCLAVFSLALSLFHVYSSLVFFAILVLYSIPVLRSSYGLDGALQMYLVVYLSLTIIAAAPSATSIPEMGLLFIGVQASVSYSIAGVSKLISSEWRSERALQGIFSARMYGNEMVHQLFDRHPTLCRLLSWGVILFESVFVLAVLADPSITLVFLSFGFAFHLFNMIFMGLNNFFFAFVSTYPSIFYLQSVI